jgi:hypothetical protein
VPTVLQGSPERDFGAQIRHWGAAQLLDDIVPADHYVILERDARSFRSERARKWILC